MKYTLLELTQAVLSSINGDEVDSITDTQEAQQVVEIIKTVYDSIVSRGGLPTHKSLFNLTSSGNSLKPVLMTMPNTVTDIEWIKYDKKRTTDTDPKWTEICYLPLHQYIDMVNSLRPSETNVDSLSHTVNGFTFSFNYRNDIGPTYYTTFDDNTLIFDGVDTAVDSTLQTSKTLCYGELANTFTMSDTWVPLLQPQQFTLLLNEAKSTAWAELKQSENPKAEQHARRGWTHLQASRRSIPVPLNKQMLGPDFGRSVRMSAFPRNLRGY